MKRPHLACVALCVGLIVPGIAQQGHPLSGTWSGDWGVAAAKRNQLTLVMDWDGKKVTGLANPGPESFPLASVVVDVSNWTVRIEADAKDKSHISAQGRLEDLGSYHRTIKGTWTQGTAKGDFKLTRN